MATLVVLLLFVPVAHARAYSDFTPASLADSANQGQESFEELLASARANIGQKRYREAEKELKLALKLNSNSPEAHLLMAMAYNEQDKPEDAIGQVRKALRIKPDYAEGNYYLARLLLNANDLAHARESIDMALAGGFRAPDAYVIRGDLAVSDSKYTDAVEFYDAALNMSPNDDEGTRNLRATTEALKDYVEFLKGGNHPSFTKPRPLTLPRPNYPEYAREKKVQGTVCSVLLVDEYGKVASVLVLKRAGFGFDYEAVRAARQMRFSPATEDGKPVPFWIKFDIEFNLR
jgi:TonB family protein